VRSPPKGARPRNCSISSKGLFLFMMITIRDVLCGIKDDRIVDSLWQGIRGFRPITAVTLASRPATSRHVDVVAGIVRRPLGKGDGEYTVVVRGGRAVAVDGLGDRNPTRHRAATALATVVANVVAAPASELSSPPVSAPSAASPSTASSAVASSSSTVTRVPRLVVGGRDRESRRGVPPRFRRRRSQGGRRAQ